MTEEFLPGVPGSTATGWVPPEDGFTKEELVGWLQKLQGDMEALWWNLGDMLNTGYVTMEDEIYQAYIYHYESKTIARVRKICAEFPMVETADKAAREAPEVSIWKHEIMAPKHIPKSEKKEVLSMAKTSDESPGLTMKEMWGEREKREQRPFGRPEELEPEPECPSCGAQSQHWQRVPAGMPRKEPATREHLRAV